MWYASTNIFFKACPVTITSAMHFLSRGSGHYLKLSQSTKVHSRLSSAHQHGGSTSSSSRDLSRGGSDGASGGTAPASCPSYKENTSISSQARNDPRGAPLTGIQGVWSNLAAVCCHISCGGSDYASGGTTSAPRPWNTRKIHQLAARHGTIPGAHH